MLSEGLSSARRELLVLLETTDNIYQPWTPDRKECAIYIYTYVYTNVYVYIYAYTYDMLKCINGVMRGSCGDWLGVSLRHSWWMLYILHMKACGPGVDCNLVLSSRKLDVSSCI